MRSEYVAEVIGTVKLRAADAINDQMKTGEVEVFLTALTIINASKTPPIYIEDGQNEKGVHPVKVPLSGSPQAKRTKHPAAPAPGDQIHPGLY